MNNQLTSTRHQGVDPTEQWTIAIAAHQVIQRAANGTPMVVKPTKKGYIIHKAKICSVCTDDVSSHHSYYRK
jgi:hypothetical protein